MRISRLSLSLLVGLFSLQFGAEALAQGAVLVRVPDMQNSHCIDPTKERAWLTLRRLITTRTKGWFTKDDSAEILLNARLHTDPPQVKPISFPLMSSADFGEYPTGQVSLPVEYKLVSGLRLLQGEHLITGLSIEMTLLNTRRKNGWGNALKALGKVTDKLPIPASPITQAASYLLEFANDAVDADVEAEDIDDKAKSATIALNFDPGADCRGGDFERTGTIAVLQPTGGDAQHLVPTDKTNDYCWQAELTPSFVLKAAPERAGVPCDDASYNDQYFTVTNNYVGFVLNARPLTGVLSLVQDNRYTAEAIGRCRANGIPERDCLR